MLHNPEIIETDIYSSACTILNDGRKATLNSKFYYNYSRKRHNKDYIQLIEKGFDSRHSYVTQFNCVNCDSPCKPIRINTQNFTPSKNQKRLIKKNKDLSFQLSPSFYERDHLMLYLKYMKDRHPKSNMNNIPVQDYIKEIIDTCDKLAILENGNDILAISFLKMNKNSSVIEYTVFDPAIKKNSLGTLMDLKLILNAQENGIQHVYLGSGNSQAPAFKYKMQYPNSEAFNKANKTWEAIERQPVVSTLDIP